VTNSELKGAIPADPSSRPVEWVLMVDRSFILSHLHLVDNLVTALICWRGLYWAGPGIVSKVEGL
jgi:hypothetical protein